jgi:hypothetical protein
MGIWLRRSIWSVALGLITAWLVAWGLAVALWADWYLMRDTYRAKGIGVVEPWVLELETHGDTVSQWESWQGERLDRDSILTNRAVKKADRVREIGGEAYDQERQQELERLIPELDELLNGQLIKEKERAEKILGKVVLPPVDRIDGKVASFPKSVFANRVAKTNADTFFMYASRIGWPTQMVMSMKGHESTFTPTGLQQPQFTEGEIEITALKRSPFPGMAPMALTLPYMPIWSGVAWNTAFFSGAWFAFFTGVAALRSLRRRMAGQCSRCGYDLKRVVGKTCPECGRTSR